MKNYKPRKVFILYSGVYTELTYEEFEKRKESDRSVADKLFIPVQGCLVETDRRHYNAFYRDKERQKYLRFLDRKHGLLSIDAFDSEDDNGTDFLQADTKELEKDRQPEIMMDFGVMKSLLHHVKSEKTIENRRK